MTDYTPEPAYSATPIKAPSGRIKRWLLAQPGRDVAEIFVASDAKRIAAALNACAGIPTERLKPGSVAELDKHFGELLSARDTQTAARQQHQNPDIAEWVWNNARAALAPFQED